MKKYNNRRKEAYFQNRTESGKPEVRHTLGEHIRMAIQEKLPQPLEEESREYLAVNGTSVIREKPRNNYQLPELTTSGHRTGAPFYPSHE